MPQVQLPIFPPGVTPITSEIAFQCEEGKVCYFNGHLPVFIHDKKELATFRLFTSQLIIKPFLLPAGPAAEPGGAPDAL